MKSFVLVSIFVYLTKGCIYRTVFYRCKISMIIVFEIFFDKLFAFAC